VAPPDRQEPITGKTSDSSGHETVSQLWGSVRPHLVASLPESTYRMWLAPLKPAARRGNTLFLEAPESVRTWVEKRYSGLILHSIAKVESSITAISFDLSPSTPESGTRPAGTVQNPTHTFDRFVIGPGNHLAHAAALAVAEAPSEAYNPLFVHGSPGLGKTHLLGSIANYLASHVPELDVRYTNAESFTAEFVSALRENVPLNSSADTGISMSC